MLHAISYSILQLVTKISILRESPFFIMFGRDALTNLQHLIKPKLRYMGTSELILDLELMSNIYQVQIHNLKLARQ